MIRDDPLSVRERSHRDGTKEENKRKEKKRVSIFLSILFSDRFVFFLFFLFFSRNIRILFLRASSDNISLKVELLLKDNSLIVEKCNSLYLFNVSVAHEENNSLPL